MKTGVYQNSKRGVRPVREALSIALARCASAVICKLVRPMAKREFANKGDGKNLARLPFAAQPRALKVGDQLVTGDFVLEPPRDGGNGSVIIKITGGWNGHEISVPSRIPIAI